MWEAGGGTGINFPTRCWLLNQSIRDKYLKDGLDMLGQSQWEELFNISNYNTQSSIMSSQRHVREKRNK